ncbi:MAG TPA: SDR family oxidoreductase [Jatrophihabitans sp.]|nr:SDR family oxidoreductase [Jatrophihabitans sp.]
MARPPRDLTGKVVVITGAARGIGAATARAVARAGGRLALGDLDGDLAASVAGELGAGAIARKLDVTDHAGFATFLDEVEDELGPLDVLINNAGIMPVAAFHEESPDSLHRQLEINLHAVIVGSQLAVQRMRPRGRGHIVNLASAAGKGGFPGVVTYCSTKFGVVGLSESLSRELHGSGVDVSCVMPALVRTELIDGVKDHWMVKTVTPEQVADAIVEALKKPRLDVFVPRSLNALNRMLALFPRRGQEWFLRASGVHHLLTDAAHSPAREAYERRAAGR